MSSEKGSITSLAYRCVCGITFVLSEETKNICPNCGRGYGPKALEASQEITAVFSGGNASGSSIRPPASGPELEDLSGSRLGHFLLIHQLGRGGMGAVYEAIDESLQRHVAIKLLSELESQGNEQYRDKLIREARAQARVSHPGVVHIYYVGVDQNRPYFAMELIRGSSLAEYLKSQKLSFADTVSVGIQVASALSVAADFDIVHGDIKPSNMLIAGPGLIKLSDFGLAQRISKRSEDESTIAGTPNYISPEAVQGQPIDIRSDMYSLGVSLFELTFGRTPYPSTGSSVMQKLKAHTEAPVVFPEPWPSELPEAWKAILQKLLAKKPGDRYPNYPQLIEELYTVLPSTIPRAAHAPRLLAYLIDFTVFLVPQLLIAIPAHLVFSKMLDFGFTYRMILSHFLVRAVTTGVSALLVFGMMVWQAGWKTTVGKMIFQIRIVDRHGLTPSRWTLMARYLLQFPLAITFPLGHAFSAFGLGILDVWIDVIAMLFMNANGVSILMSADGRGIHDRILGTKVVIDDKGRRV